MLFEISVHSVKNTLSNSIQIGKKFKKAAKLAILQRMLQLNLLLLQ